MAKPTIIFFGTSDFAVPVLEALLKNKYKIIAVITQPDSESGRGQKIKTSPIKEVALKNKLKIIQPENAKDEKFIQQIKNMAPDLNIVCAYGKILPEELIEAPKYKTINIHPSMLPKYRGPSPIQSTILNGDKDTGTTVMLMNAKMDHGPIIKNYKVKIKDRYTITFEELSKKLADASAKLLIKILPKYISGETKPKEQKHEKATFVKLFRKEDGKIYWNKTSEEIDRQVRALNPWPGSFCFWHNHEKEQTIRVKILKTEIPYISSAADIVEKRKNGEVFKTPSGLMAVATFDDHLIIKELQLEGKKVMSGKEFLNGYPRIVGSLLT